MNELPDGWIDTMGGLREPFRRNNNTNTQKHDLRNVLCGEYCCTNQIESPLTDINFLQFGHCLLCTQLGECAASLNGRQRLFGQANLGRRQEAVGGGDGSVLLVLLQPTCCVQ